MNNKILIVSANYYIEISRNHELGASNTLKDNAFESLQYFLKNLHLRILSEKYIEQMQVLFVTWYNFAFLIQ